jgi:hypothetical protein
MNAKSFFGKIREIIQEEIEYAIDKKINEQTISKMVESKQHKSIQNTKNSIKTKKNVDNFSSIQDLLNETKRSLQESMEYDDEMMFTSDMVNGFASRNHMGAIPNGYSPEDVPEEVMSALTKDYSALMKKIDEKKGR